MAGEPIITVIGNLTADPELRQAGQHSVANFTIASTPRTFDRQKNEYVDGEALFLRCSIWREYADHVVASLRKGMQVIAQGRLVQRSYTDKENNNRTSIELQVDDIGPSLRFATAQVTRAGQGGGQQAPQQPQQGSYGPPQGNYGPPQGAQAPGGMAPQQPQGAPQQPQQGYPPQQGQMAPQAPQQAAQPQQQGAYPGVQQQAPQPGSFQAAQQGDWSNPVFDTNTPF